MISVDLTGLFNHHKMTEWLLVHWTMEDMSFQPLTHLTGLGVARTDDQNFIRT